MQTLRHSVAVSRSSCIYIHNVSTFSFISQSVHTIIDYFLIFRDIETETRCQTPIFIEYIQRCPIIYDRRIRERSSEKERSAELAWNKVAKKTNMSGMYSSWQNYCKHSCKKCSCILDVCKCV